MATVFLSRDLRHDRNVALKVLKPELAALLGAERFLSEIRVMANLQHPNLVPLFDSGESDGRLFYVMPYIEGESLRQRLEREKQPRWMRPSGSRSPFVARSITHTGTWNPRGGELFYRSGARLIAAKLALGSDQPKLGVDTLPVRLTTPTGGPWATYDVSPDGQRFLTSKAPAALDQPIVITGWLDDVREKLKARAPR